jgi:Mrp family chromosome partitioning ATPase
MRTRLLYAVADTPRTVILITSPGLADGKSTTRANLGVALAQAGKATLVVDGDLRDPSLHEIFGVPSVKRVVNKLSGITISRR